MSSMAAFTGRIPTFSEVLSSNIRTWRRMHFALTQSLAPVVTSAAAGESRRPARARSCGESRGTLGNKVLAHRAQCLSAAGQPGNCPQVTQASQTEDSRIVVRGWPARLALVDGASSVAEAGGGAARHTRA